MSFLEMLPVVLSADVTIPDVTPDFNAPFMGGLWRIVSWVLAGAIAIVFLLLIVAVAALALRGVFPDNVRAWAGENLVKIIVAVIALGSVGGLFQYFVNFDFGF